MRPREDASELERRLADLCGRKHGVVVGRATTAISLATRALCVRPGMKVLIPALLCPSAANGVLYAGAEPYFVDVDLVDANVSVGSCTRVFAQEKDVAGVLVPHMYGHPADVEALVELARAHDAFVIEDAAQSLGGSFGGRPLGSFGETSVVSFGQTKIVDAGWGGALLTDRDDVASFARDARERLPGRTPEVDELKREYRRLYYALMPVVEEHPRLDALLARLPELFEDMYLRGPGGVPIEGILAGIEDLDGIVAARRARAERYHNGLSHEDVVRFEPRDGWIPWRYSFRVPEVGRTALLEGLRAKGFDASAWYPPIHRWYPSGREQDAASIPNSIRLGREVVNLWVDPRFSLEHVDRTIHLTNELLAGRARVHG